MVNGITLSLSRGRSTAGGEGRQRHTSCSGGALDPHLRRRPARCCPDLGGGPPHHVVHRSGLPRRRLPRRRRGAGLGESDPGGRGGVPGCRAGPLRGAVRRRYAIGLAGPAPGLAAARAGAGARSAVDHDHHRPVGALRGRSGLGRVLAGGSRAGPDRSGFRSRPRGKRQGARPAAAAAQCGVGHQRRPGPAVRTGLPGGRGTLGGDPCGRAGPGDRPGRGHRRAGTAVGHLAGVAADPVRLDRLCPAERLRDRSPGLCGDLGGARQPVPGRLRGRHHRRDGGTESARILRAVR